MLTCDPRSIFSWTFDVSGALAGRAWVGFSWPGEQGAIALGGSEFAIRKHGFMSGHWTLEDGSGVLAEAEKTNPLLRSFRMQAAGMDLIVRAQSPMTRCFVIELGERVLGEIRPAHPWTRRAYIECDPSLPEFVQLYAFWLAALTWRRRNNS